MYVRHARAVYICAVCTMVAQVSTHYVPGAHCLKIRAHADEFTLRSRVYLYRKVSRDYVLCYNMGPEARRA